ncbi:MAG: HAD family hydrolase [Tissierellia bacterium]|nr:HAD family hydrolase [Tissierellia bacterium]
MYEAVCIDLDGTLLDDNKKISEKNIEILNKVKDKGIEIIIATGRALPRAIDFTNVLGFKHTLIANNGAVISDNKEEKIFDYNPIPQRVFKEVYDIGKDLGVYPVIHIYEQKLKTSLIIPDKDEVQWHKQSVPSLEYISKYSDFDIMNLNNIMTMVYIENVNLVDEFRNLVNKRDIICQNHVLNIFKKDKIMFECLNKEANKIIGVEKLLKLKNINLKNTIALGDETNDFNMLRKVGCGIAMKNGTKAIKEISNKVSEYDNNNSGVAIELEKIFLK